MYTKEKKEHTLRLSLLGYVISEDYIDIILCCKNAKCYVSN